MIAYSSLIPRERFKRLPSDQGMMFLKLSLHTCSQREYVWLGAGKALSHQADRPDSKQPSAEWRLVPALGAARVCPWAPQVAGVLDSKSRLRAGLSRVREAGLWPLSATSHLWGPRESQLPIDIHEGTE